MICLSDIPQEVIRARLAALDFSPGGRGFLTHYPPDVVRVVNGVPVTRSDILAAKRERQARELAWKRRSREDRIVPCFVNVFYNPHFPYMGWWLYVLTRKSQYGVGFRGVSGTLLLDCMQVYPCGFLPIAQFERE